MKKEYCHIISSMRAGSTLLKALIATRPDCSDLPETAFQDFNLIKSKKKIILLKKPATYKDFDYPQIINKQSKNIVLIRNPYDTVSSLQNMLKSQKNENYIFYDLVYLVSYWYMVYNNIIEKEIVQNEKTLLVRYEDLIANPNEETSKVFKFIETSYTEGTDCYIAPTNYIWEWGKDDGGDMIKTLKVQKNFKKRSNYELLEFVNNNTQIQYVLKYFGYTNTEVS